MTLLLAQQSAVHKDLVQTRMQLVIHIVTDFVEKEVILKVEVVTETGVVVKKINLDIATIRIVC